MGECGRAHLALRRPALPRNGNVACGLGVVGAASEEDGPAKPQGPCSHFGLQAVQQTSSEFLAAAAHSDRFSEEDRALLARFMEKCDLIQFARIPATEEDNRSLLSSAIAFVQATRA